MKAEGHQSQVEAAIAELKSLHEGDRGVVRVVACGSPVLPALRSLLLGREPSGLYETRCRAVAALAALGANDILTEFLETERSIADPIERLGEDAVINAAALAVAKRHDRRTFDLLLRLARLRPALSGVVGALGAFKSAEAIGALINALEEDASRMTAEAALKKLGRSALPDLLLTAGVKQPSRERESESSVRRRRAALRLLAEIGIPRSGWPSLRSLIQDHDGRVAVEACKICLARASKAQQQEAVGRLIMLLAVVDWILREQIEGTLASHFSSTRAMIEQRLSDTSPIGKAEGARTIRESLRRVLTRAGSTQRPR